LTDGNSVLLPKGGHAGIGIFASLAPDAGNSPSRK
jgi:hypothetical protein